MDIAYIIDYLKRLAVNNNREWFNAYKDDYLTARGEFEKLISRLIANLSTFDVSVASVDPKECIYRIYRDVRFSPDKSPYKRHFAAYINSKGKKSYHCGYYFHLQPEGSLIAGGGYELTPQMSKALRQSVYYQIDEFRSIVEKPEFVELYPVIGENFLKTAPKGYPKDFEYIKYLQCKEYVVSNRISDESLLQASMVEDITHRFKVMKPFLDFLNETIDDYE